MQHRIIMLILYLAFDILDCKELKLLLFQQITDAINNGSNYRESHQSQSKASELVTHPLIQFVTGKGKKGNNGHHFKPKA